MIHGIGTDIIELARIERLMSDKFITRILHADERAALKKMSSTKRRTEYVAGRFAVKEAYAKALGTGIGALRFHDICCLNDAHGKPYIIDPSYDVHVSISHSNEAALAFVVLEGKA